MNFVVRNKENLSFKSIKEISLQEQRHQHILKDEIIELTGVLSVTKYLKQLRKVTIWEDVNQQAIELITNQFSWSANTIGELYKSRWQVEIFFREIKQLLNIKSFIDISENAVMIQKWTALITILILKVLKASANFNWHLSNLVAFIWLNLFEKIDFQLLIDKPYQNHVLIINKNTIQEVLI